MYSRIPRAGDAWQVPWAAADRCAIYDPDKVAGEGTFYMEFVLLVAWRIPCDAFAVSECERTFQRTDYVWKGSPRLRNISRKAGLEPFALSINGYDKRANGKFGGFAPRMRVKRLSASAGYRSCISSFSVNSWKVKLVNEIFAIDLPCFVRLKKRRWTRFAFWLAVRSPSLYAPYHDRSRFTIIMPDAGHITQSSSASRYLCS